MSKPFEPMQVVVAIEESCFSRNPWREGDYLLYLGKVVNTQAIVVATRDGRVFWGNYKNEIRHPTKKELDGYNPTTYY